MWKRCRSTAKRYPGDNRLILPKSPYRRQSLAPRCRLVASWGWSRSQGLGCSPIKAVRELGLERRETVNQPALSKNSAKCWKLRMHPAVPAATIAPVTIRQAGGYHSRAGQSAGKAGDPRRSPESSEAIRRTRSPSLEGWAREEMVRPPWRRGEPGGTETTWTPGGRGRSEVTDVSVPILRGRRRFEESCP